MISRTSASDSTADRRRPANHTAAQPSISPATTHTARPASRESSDGPAAFDCSTVTVTSSDATPADPRTFAAYAGNSASSASPVRCTESTSLPANTMFTTAASCGAVAVTVAGSIPMPSRWSRALTRSPSPTPGASDAKSCARLRAYCSPCTASDGLPLVGGRTYTDATMVTSSDAVRFRMTPPPRPRIPHSAITSQGANHRSRINMVCLLSSRADRSGSTAQPRIPAVASTALRIRG